MNLFAELAPLSGRLAFAAVFFALAIWLVVMPKQLLGEDGATGPKPIWKQVRTWAVFIAVVQLFIYLFWKWEVCRS